MKKFADIAVTKDDHGSALMKGKQTETAVFSGMLA